ncbi:F-box/kelch-repeat protein At3g06240-like [Coffea eugenioides]|uniref:F-box/kelch-repeat protein At3g06240-like n=1 Tax=Coffea eugenioides TaxID=49369 RepID=UPI000F60FA18|nr:F-box/kelch-repeat protein At3g06240-like [Coffea eugenioides]
MDMKSCKRVRPRRSSQAKVRIMDLPTCIFVEIFKRLPVKTILKCRTLNKTFSKLLTEPDFLNAHQKQKPLAILLEPLVRVVVTDKYARPLRFLEFGHEQGEVGFTSGKSMRANTKPIRGNFYVVGSCNGLVCIEHYFGSCPEFRSNVLICNPILGECQILPEGRSVDDDMITGGFGVDPSTNLYKVLLVHSDIGGKSYSEIFTVGVDVNWRILEMVNCPYVLDPQGLLFRGAMHWMARERTSNTRIAVFIYAFDIGEERFRSILAPPLDMETNKARSLLVLRNSLHIIFCLP